MIMLNWKRQKHLLICQYKTIGRHSLPLPKENIVSIQVDFESVLCFLGVNITKKNGNIRCPFCGKNSFRIYDDTQKGYCHNKSCRFNGNALDFCMKYENCSKDEAYQKLINMLRKNEKSILQTYNDAFNELASDLNFLAWVRMYAAFYGNSRFNQKEFCKKLDITTSTFNKILNGNLGNGLTWRKTLNVLKNEINIDKFKNDLKSGTQFFKNFINENKNEYNIEKFRIKNKKIK